MAPGKTDAKPVKLLSSGGVPIRDGEKCTVPLTVYFEEGQRLVFYDIPLTVAGLARPFDEMDICTIRCTAVREFIVHPDEGVPLPKWVWLPLGLGWTWLRLTP